MKFKKWVEKTLIGIEIFIFLFFVTLEDFDLSALPFLIGLFMVGVFIFKLLDKYGRIIKE